MTPGKRPTLRDVADHAGVSFKTVARVANGEAGVSAALAARVGASIATLGYRPDERAKNLRSSDRRSKTVGFVQVDAANPFSSAIFRGLEDVAADHGFLVLSGSSDGSAEREQMLVSTLLNRRVDGLIIVPSADEHDALLSELGRGTPIIFVDRDPGYAPQGKLIGDVIRTDHRVAAELAVRHLISFGHRRIGFLGTDPSGFSARERYDGYRSALDEAGIEGDEALVRSVNGVEDAANATRDLFTGTDAPTALFSSQNLATLGSVRALHELGLRRRIAHVGLDEVDLAAALDPALTLVPQAPREIGRLAGERFFARLAEPTLEPTRQLLVPQLVPRGSGEIPAPS